LRWDLRVWKWPHVPLVWESQRHFAVPARARIVETAQVRPGDLEGKPIPGPGTLLIGARGPQARAQGASVCMASKWLVTGVVKGLKQRKNTHMKKKSTRVLNKTRKR
jgi:hypothetical protein